MREQGTHSFLSLGLVIGMRTLPPYSFAPSGSQGQPGFKEWRKIVPPVDGKTVISHCEDHRLKKGVKQLFLQSVYERSHLQIY